MKRNVVVVGGGFAGAAAASALAEAGLTVTLLERRPFLGGRTHSLRDGVTREAVDNGQHLFMGCYRETRKFLRRLGVENRLVFFPELAVPFVESDGGRWMLRAPNWPFGLGLLRGLFGFGALRLRDKLGVLRALLRLRWSRRALTGLSVSRWLDERRQSARARRNFWDPLCYATLNENPGRASAEALAVVLRRGVMGRPGERVLGYASVNLGKLWSVELSTYLKSRNGVVGHGQRVTGFETVEGRVTGLRLEDGNRGDADAVVCAAPAWEFMEICPPEIRPALEEGAAPESQSIVSINLWFDKPPFEEPFWGMLGTEVQWVFNRRRLWGGAASEGYVSCVVSDAGGLAGKTQEELIEMAVGDIRQCFRSFRGELRRGSVVWEKRATPSNSPGHWARRPSVTTALPNFFLAGDWVDTGLPATIEAACSSGHRAAQAAIKYLESTAC
jgi:squalene-associated FAD-dependent desaturase